MSRVTEVSMKYTISLFTPRGSGESQVACDELARVIVKPEPLIKCVAQPGTHSCRPSEFLGLAPACSAILSHLFSTPAPPLSTPACADSALAALCYVCVDAPALAL